MWCKTPVKTLKNNTSSDSVISLSFVWCQAAKIRCPFFKAMKTTSSSLLCTQLMKRVAILAVCLFVFCEWLIYYLVIFQCSWPDIDLEGTNRRFEPLKTMMLTDTHLLGPKHGHWFDKLRREWQMERAFQTAVSHFRPDVVFLLGDLFDEGMTSNDEVSCWQLIPFFKPGEFCVGMQHTGTQYMVMVFGIK